MFPKNLDLNPQPTKPRRVAIVGQVAAGDPVEDVEYLPFIKWYDARVPGWARDSDQFVGVKIVGDSLVNDGIADGDIAIVYMTHDVREGDLAAVLTPFGMTIKYVYSELGNVVRLEGANDTYAPRRFDVSEVTVQGRVVGTDPPKNQ